VAYLDELTSAGVPPGRVVLPGQQVVLDTDAERARPAGRASVVTPALHVANYWGVRHPLCLLC
jgi:hypothetical protein